MQPFRPGTSQHSVTPCDMSIFLESVHSVKYPLVQTEIGIFVRQLPTLAFGAVHSYPPPSQAFFVTFVLFENVILHRRFNG